MFGRLELEPESIRCGPKDGELFNIIGQPETVDYKFRGSRVQDIVGAKVLPPSPADASFQIIPFYTQTGKTAAPILRIYKPDNPARLLLRDYALATNSTTGGRYYEPVPKSHDRPKEEDDIDLKINVRFSDGERSMDGVIMTEIVTPDRKAIVRFPTALFFVADSLNQKGSRQREIRQPIMEGVIEDASGKRKIYIPATLNPKKNLDGDVYGLEPVDRSFAVISRPPQPIPAPEIIIHDESESASPWGKRIAIATLVLAALGAGGAALGKIAGCNVAPDSSKEKNGLQQDSQDANSDY